MSDPPSIVFFQERCNPLCTSSMCHCHLISLYITTSKGGTSRYFTQVDISLAITFDLRSVYGAQSFIVQSLGPVFYQRFCLPRRRHRALRGTSVPFSERELPSPSRAMKAKKRKWMPTTLEPVNKAPNHKFGKFHKKLPWKVADA